MPCDAALLRVPAVPAALPASHHSAGLWEGVERLIFGTPRSERFSLVASPEMLETKIHFLFRQREKISPKVQPPALAASSINTLCSRALLLFLLVAFSFSRCIRHKLYKAHLFGAHGTRSLELLACQERAF